MERAHLLAAALEARHGEQRPEGTTYGPYVPHQAGRYVMVPSMLQEAVLDFLATNDSVAYRGDDDRA